MNKLMYFILGMFLGNFTGVTLMCMLQINRLNKIIEDKNKIL